MKEFCNRLMKFNTDIPFGEDYSTIILLMFLREEGFVENKYYEISKFSTYLYRFYSDKTELRNKHYHKMISALWHYQPNDLYDYSREILDFVSRSTDFISIKGIYFVLNYCPDELSACKEMVDSVINILIEKYLGNDYVKYISKLDKDEFQGVSVFKNDTRVFNRALETINYCFICDENQIENLCAVTLKDKSCYCEDNYLILCKQHGELFKNRKLIIKRNGYPYIYNERQYEHLEIGILKKVRRNLDDSEVV